MVKRTNEEAKAVKKFTYLSKKSLDRVYEWATRTDLNEEDQELADAYLGTVTALVGYENFLESSRLPKELWSLSHQVRFELADDAYRVRDTVGRYILKKKLRPVAILRKITSLEEFCAEAKRRGLTAADLAEVLKRRPEFADCLPDGVEGRTK